MVLRSPRRAFAAGLILSALVAAACGSGQRSADPVSPSGATGPCPATPAPATTPKGWDVSAQRPSLTPELIDPGTIACGRTRFMFSFIDADLVPAASPARTVEVALYDLGADPSTPLETVPATFIWAIEPTVGVYVVDTTFPTSGAWGAELRTSIGDAEPEVIRIRFDVRAEASVVTAGDAAPAVDTPTLADVGGDVTMISTDPDPVPAFYETSVADALAAREPFVLAFATPKFCVTAQCGPTLDRLKPIAAAYPEMTFINVEPYELETVDGQLQPVLTGDPPVLTPTEATTTWRLPAEPWVFVVDRDGIVRASLMLIFGDEELEAAIEDVLPAS